jgi:hypothetical protein
MIRYYFLFGIILSTILYICGCEALVSNQSKPDVPADHDILLGIFLHKSGEREALGCDECHGSDLKGGVQSLNGKYIYVQSCYQCHGELWERGRDKK